MKNNRNRYQIGAKTLDLNKEIPLIVAQLDKLAEFFYIKTLCKKR